MFYVTKKVDSHHFMVKDTYDGAVEIYSDEQLYNLEKKGRVRVFGVHYKVTGNGVEKYIVVPKSKSGALYCTDSFFLYARYLLVDALRRAHICLFDEDCIFEDSTLTLAVYCIGGSYEWGTDEYGNMTLLDKALERKIMEVTKKCAKEEGIKIEIYPGEKGYTYFRFDV